MKKAKTGKLESPATLTNLPIAERTLTRAHKRVVTQTERDEVAVMRSPDSTDRAAKTESQNKTE